MNLENLKDMMPLPDIENISPVLFVGPHPDDIEFGAGGTVAKLTAKGAKVTFLIATDGRCGSSDPDIDPKELAKVRRAEAIDSAKLLGVTDVRFLDFPDGGIYNSDDMFIAMLKAYVEIKPKLVFCPDPYLISECHSDHIKTGEAASRAFQGCSNIHLMRSVGVNDKANPQAIAFYYTNRPNTFIDITDYNSLREEALAEHKSQFPEIEGFSLVLEALKQYSFMRAEDMAELSKASNELSEGFFVMSNMHAHCIPEINNFFRCP